MAGAVPEGLGCDCLLLFNNKAADPVSQGQQANQGAGREGRKNRLVSLEFKL